VLSDDIYDICIIPVEDVVCDLAGAIMEGQTLKWCLEAIEGGVDEVWFIKDGLRVGLIHNIGQEDASGKTS